MNEWISVKDSLPPGKAAIVMVRRENGNEVKAYYFRDQGSFGGWAGLGSYFQDFHSHDAIHDATHWKYVQGWHPK